MHDSDFFRQATLQLHSSLEIEVALGRCLPVLRRCMPAARMGLFLYDRERATLRLIARATSEGGERIDRVVHLSPEANAAASRFDDAGEQVANLGNFQATPLGRELREAFQPKVESYLALQVEVEGKKLAYLAIAAEGKAEFTDDHSRLLASLKGPFAITVSNALRHQEVLRLKALLDDDNRYLREELLRASGEELVGEASGLAEVMALVRQVARSSSPVLLLGETGVGKEVVANAVHRLSPRAQGPLIKVNCGAIPETLVDSELFGHERGAFTGAVNTKRGRFERAHKGTLFLDEIGELPATAQTRLLRVLQDRIVERVGGGTGIPVDLRVVVATNRDLHRMVQDGQFRQDLWFRLNVFPITIPPLRDRKVDIPALVAHFVTKKAVDLRLSSAPSLAPGALEALGAHDWPGNVRELENIVERALILDRQGPLRFEHLLELGTQSRIEPVETIPLALDDVVASHIRKVLRISKGKVHGPGGAAALLGVNPSTLRARMQKLGIPYGRRR